MSILFHEPFMARFIEYASPRLREINIWMWIMEYRKTKQVHEIV
jgi:hypothetical protein